MTTSQEPGKSRTTKLEAALIAIGFLLLGGAIIFINNPNVIPSIKIQIYTPKPIVITSRADNSKSGLL